MRQENEREAERQALKRRIEKQEEERRRQIEQDKALLLAEHEAMLVSVSRAEQCQKQALDKSGSDDEINDEMRNLASGDIFKKAFEEELDEFEKLEDEVQKEVVFKRGDQLDRTMALENDEIEE